MVSLVSFRQVVSYCASIIEHEDIGYYRSVNWNYPIDQLMEKIILEFVMVVNDLQVFDGISLWYFLLT